MYNDQNEPIEQDTTANPDGWTGDDVSEFDGEQEANMEDDREGYESHDLSDDGDALASAGFGTDEDYGSYGGEDW